MPAPYPSAESLAVLALSKESSLRICWESDRLQKYEPLREYAISQVVTNMILVAVDNEVDGRASTTTLLIEERR